MFHAGQQIGVYTLINRIGRGGFGEVWLAERRAKFATTQVAVKLPLDEQVDHTTIEQEAQLWAQASGHANVLPIIEADDYDGQIVIVSEYVPDGSLEQLLKSNGGLLPVKQAVELTLGILKGLEFLHSRKIIHRDLKPANILMQGDTPRLADFGISRAMRTTSVSASIAGTPKYMAPEAFKGKRNVQTDIWSVGVLLYQMLAGKLPFPQDDYGELIGAIVTEEPAPLPDTIPAALRKVVSTALSKKNADRYSSAREMRDELDGKTTVPRPMPPPPAPKRTNALYFAVSAVVLLLFAFIGGAYWLFSGWITPNTNNAQSIATPLPSGITATTLIPFRKGDKFGFSDEYKNLIIKPKYDLASPFIKEFDGLAAVVTYGETGLHEPRMGFIDKTGKEVTDLKYESLDEGGFSEGLLGVKWNKKVGFIDRTGKEVIQNKYDGAGAFVQGLAPVFDMENNKMGFINKRGEEVIPLIYDIPDKDSSWENHDNIFGFKEGLSKVLRKDKDGFKYGFIDRMGKEVIPLRYSAASAFYDGLALVKYAGKSSFIDKIGKEVLSLQYERVGLFTEGFAKVCNDKCGFIDKTGKEIFPLRYNGIFTESFSDGLALVERNYNPRKFTFIDKTGKEIVFIKYEDMNNFKEGLAYTKSNGKVGYVDKTDNVVIQFKYDSASDFRQGLAFVRLNGKQFFISKDGTEYYEP